MTKRNTAVNDKMRKEVMLVLVKPLDLSNEDCEYYNRAEIFEDTVLLFEDSDAGEEYVDVVEYGVDDKVYMFIPKRALKKYYKLRLTLGRLNCHCEYDRQLAAQFNTALDSELNHLWNKYSTSTWFRKARPIYNIYNLFQ